MLLGFSGRARHGKTVAAEAVYRHALSQGKTAKLYDIGDLIRRHCISTGRLPVVERKDMNRDQLEILINVGKEQRAIDVNFWVKQMMVAIAEENLDVALCPNARFESEVMAIHAAGGFIVRCTRLNPNGSIFISEDRPPNDISETAFEFCPADFYLTSKDGQLDFMAAQAVAVYKFLLEQKS